MNKKIKNKISTYDPKEYLDIFKSYKNNYNEHEYYKKMYEEIYDYYKEKDNKFICIERVRLQGRTGRYNKALKNINSSLLVLAITFLVNNLMLAISQSSISYKSYIIYGTSLIIYSFILFTIYRNIKDNDNFILDMTLQVLDDIEKEMKSKTEQVILNYEVAATVQDEDEKHKQYVSEGNFNINVSVPNVIEIFESVYRVGRFARKIFRKKK